MNRSGKMVHDFLTGLQFLTRLRLVAQKDWSPERFGRSVKYFPLIGLFSGGLLALAAFSTAGWMPGTFRISLLLCAGFLVHGFLHEDGLMDTADGLFSGQDRQRMLEIMKDSRVGAGGVVSIILLLLLKWSLMMDMPSSILPYALLFATVFGRFAIAISVVAFPYARADGMGKAFVEHAGPNSGWVAAMITLAIWAGSVWMAPPVVAKAAGVAGVCCIGLTWFFGTCLTSRLGGLTGDTYGAACELTELLTLLVFLLVATFRMELF